MDARFTKAYNPQETEERIYTLWEESGFFNPDVCIEKGICTPDAEPFSIVLPPPNETGILHTGHASMVTIEDIMVRYNRMRGLRTTWIPGTDHAAIATNAKVEKLLDKKGIKRRDIGREAFLEEVKKYTTESRGTILSQVRAMGASLDWSRQAYTFDNRRGKAVFETFKRMYDAGLIYRGDRIVNWDPKGQTVISDDEIVRKEETAPFYYIKYGPFTIGTSRPETKFGDKYVVVHPDDKRYAEYTHSQDIELEWIDGPITATIIKDEAIDMAFGSGVMTITPWHDKTDFDIAERHNLDKVQIIDQYGKLLPVAGQFAGMKITEARDKLVEHLQKKGLIERIDENYTHQLATAERSGGIIEPQIMRQWFVDVNKKVPFPHVSIDGIDPKKPVSLKEVMRHVVESKQITILPDRFRKIYLHWTDILHDWCISRQIWFGHRIPAWYRDDEITISQTQPEGDGWIQDEDTLDTWFSSALWTFSTLGWPDDTADLATYHPTKVLETGYDILFFWVAKMVLMSTYLVGEIPFQTVYLHGLLRDEKGRKISKSLGNNIDPVDVSERFGTDAFRMSLIVGVGPGADNNLSENKIRAYKKFANKLWNIARFVIENTEGYDITKKPKLRSIDEKDLKKFEGLAKEVTDDIENYRLYLAAEKLYHYIWHSFADETIERSKTVPTLDEIAEEAKEVFQDHVGLKAKDWAKESSAWLLNHILRNYLILLHPFMPFITEEIWQHSGFARAERPLLLVEEWPNKTKRA